VSRGRVHLKAVHKRLHKHKAQAETFGICGKCRFKGFFNIFNAPADHLRNALEQALDREPIINLVFNLAGVSFIDSSGLGVLLGRYKRVSKNGGKVMLVSPQPQVRRILELSGLFRIMDELSSESEALVKPVREGL
jgi:stage II sporulation protein AA (anti-sigma F factor antagonist)